MDDGENPKANQDRGNAERNSWFAEFLKKLNRKNEDQVTEKDIISIIKEGHEKGVLQANEAEMIHNIFEFSDKEAKDIMTHRKNICALDGTMEFGQMVDKVLDEPFSRFPVYLEDIDNIIGVLHIKEVMAFERNQKLAHTQIKDIDGLFQEGEFIPETQKISDLFQRMQSDKLHLVIVVDEYGQTCGLVAMEDILEEIVGNIFDEHDKESHMIEHMPDGSYIMQGMTGLDDAKDALGIEFEEEDYDTLNGFLISKINKIPADGETFSIEYGGYLFDVVKVENKTVQTVRITLATRRIK